MANKVGFDDTAYKNTQAKPTNLRENPFNQTSPRFATFDYKIRSTFGSSQYRISVFVNENFRKPVVEGSKKSPVNVSSVRRLNITRKDKFSAPSASSDDVKTESFKTKIERSPSNFVSSTA